MDGFFELPLIHSAYWIGDESTQAPEIELDDIDNLENEDLVVRAQRGWALVVCPRFEEEDFIELLTQDFGDGAIRAIDKSMWTAVRRVSIDTTGPLSVMTLEQSYIGSISKSVGHLEMTIASRMRTSDLVGPDEISLSHLIYVRRVAG